MNEVASTDEGAEFLLLHFKINFMLPNQILQASLLDIVFDGRNKSYGAYALRKSYSEALIKALLISTSFAGFMLCFTWQNETAAERKASLPDIVFYKTVELPALSRPLANPPSTEQPIRNKAKGVQSGNFKPVIVAETAIPAIISLPQSAALPQPGLLKPGTAWGPDDFPEKPALASKPATTAVAAKPQIPAPAAAAEIMPAFPGGEKKLLDFLSKNLVAPEPINEGETVKVIVQFVVGIDGKLKSFEVVKDGGTSFNEEVIRVLKLMPDWVPGKSNGKTAAVYYSIPVVFAPENDG